MAGKLALTPFVHPVLSTLCKSRFVQGQKIKKGPPFDRQRRRRCLGQDSQRKRTSLRREGAR